MRVLAIVIVTLLAGCSKDDPIPLPTETFVPGDAYFDDPVDEDVDAVYDLLRANFTELNGSLVLSIELRDVYSPVPRLVNVFDVVVGEQRTTFIARTIPDTSRPAPSISYELVRVEGGSETILGRICGIHGMAEKPPRVMFDLPHNMTGLEGGGSLVRLHTEVHNFEDETLYDSADAEKGYAVKGGPNPYDTCPLIAERGQQQ